ncbi:MAG TPA: ATP-dependent sacrificial sulfur transferase LarE [Chthoniobacteraceae bacterium]|nr:ATP-dependent sacrificial sulfur transferase LarE [Chthoniobacteraceae bacterium]
MNPKKEIRLREHLLSHAPLVIAYSGGVDSACLLAVAHETLGDKMLGVIADSPSLPRKALADALALAEQIGAPVEVIRTDEMEDPNYTGNPVNRCYFCKSELFNKLDQLARERGFAAIAYGENADDANHFRPGRQAAAEFAVIAPLKDAGIDKAEVREISRARGLPTADAPSQPCLSSRIPHGTPVTVQALAMVERGEDFVRGLGFRVFRVRHLVEDEAAGKFRARVQIAPEEMSRISSCEPALVSGLAAVGYAAVEIDPAGYRSPA